MARQMNPKMCQECGTVFVPTGGRQIACTNCTDIIRKEVQRRYRTSNKGKARTHEAYVRYINSEKGQQTREQYYAAKEQERGPKKPTRAVRVAEIKSAFAE